MFTSDKELRSKKPLSSTASGTTSAAGNRRQTALPSIPSTAEDILEVSKQRREERQLLREHSKVTIQLQAWWRCRHQRKIWIHSLENEFKNKAADIVRLNALLKTQICTDARMCLYLTRLVVLSVSYSNLHTYCTAILSVSLTNMDPNKNLAAQISTYLACRVLELLLTYLNRIVKYSNEADEEAYPIISCIPLLIGQGVSFKMNFNEVIQSSFVNIRRKCFEKDVMHSITMTLFKKLHRWMLTTSEDETAISNTEGKLKPKWSRCFDVLLLFASDFIYSDPDPSLRERRLARFIRTIWTTPMVTLLFSKEALSSFVASNTFAAALKWCNAQYPSLQLPPSLLPAFTPDSWLLGNFMSVAHDVLQVPQLLLEFIDLSTKLLSAVHVPGLLHGKRGVVWTKTGTESVAAGVPSGLYTQLTPVFDATFLIGLDKILLSSIDELARPCAGRAEDLVAIEEALRNSGALVTSQAVQEGALERTWLSGKWASKLLKNMGQSLGLSKEPRPVSVSTSVAGRKVAPISSKDVFAFSSLCSIVLAPAALASHTTENWKGLSGLVFALDSLPLRLWTALVDMNVEAFSSCFTPAKDLHPYGVYGLMATLAIVLRIRLIVCEDSELYDEEKPLPLHQIVLIIRSFKSVLFKTIQHDNSLLSDFTLKNAASATGYKMYAYHTTKVISLVLNDLYTRWARRPFSTPALFEIKDANTVSMRQQLRNSSPLAMALVEAMPWCIEFYERLTFFREILTFNRNSVQGPEHARRLEDVVVLRIRRKFILEDGMKAMRSIGPDIKKRLVIKYVNEFNQEEMGIDSGGLFKDFWTDLSSQVLNSSYGLFSVTSTRHLFPSSTSLTLYNERENQWMYCFLGTVLGKAIFENITVQPQFAHFFLSFMHGKYNFTGLVNDLISLDVELYKNLMFLKVYDGDVEDLSLTFSVSDTSLGTNREIELIPGGANISVNSSNKHRYISAVAKYYLHDRIKLQAQSFIEGLHQVIDPSLLRMFCAPELQFLISGASSAIKIDDLQRNTAYQAGYSSFDRNISRFWAVLQELSQEDLALLIRFVTSCDRPPSLGFADLHPPFTIQRVDSEQDSRLPTASTCFNVLKLPVYSSQSILKDKLLFAIRSRSGFDLS